MFFFYHPLGGISSGTHDGLVKRSPPSYIYVYIYIYLLECTRRFHRRHLPDPSFPDKNPNGPKSPKSCEAASLFYLWIYIHVYISMDIYPWIYISMDIYPWIYIHGYISIDKKGSRLRRISEISGRSDFCRGRRGRGDGVDGIDGYTLVNIYIYIHIYRREGSV